MLENGSDVSSINETIVQESVQRLRDQKQELTQQIRDYKKVTGNSQAKVKQAGLQYCQEEHIFRKMQETLKLSQNKVDTLCKEYQDHLKANDFVKQKLASKEDDEWKQQRSWQEQWGQDCRNVAVEFRNAYGLFGNESSLRRAEIENIKEQVKERQVAVTTLLGKERILRSTHGELSREVNRITPELEFLRSPEAAHAVEVISFNSDAKENLKIEIERLKKEEYDLKS